MMRSHQDPRPSTSADGLAVPQIQVVSPAEGTKTRRRVPRDTGFPEPLDEGRNTTLPHPDADLSPNATICPEVAADRALKRHKLFFLSKNKRTISHGTIMPETEALQSALSLPLTDGNAGGKKETLRFVSPSASSLRLSKDGGESLHSRKGGGDGEDYTPPTSPDVSEHRRKTSLLGRLRRKS